MLKLFPEQRQGEKIYLISKKHPFLMLKSLLILFSALVVLFIILRVTGFSLSSLYIVIIFGFVFGTYGFFLWNSWNKTRYILTNLRAIEIEQKGFFTKEVAEAALENIRDVRWKKSGFWATILNFGDVKIKTTAGIGAIKWQGVAEPDKIQQKIFDAKEDREKSKIKK